MKHYKDKYDVMNYIYLRKMEPHLLDSLEAWYACMSELALREWDYFKNANQYYGQNSLSDTVELDFKKFMLHVKESVLSDVKKKVHFTYALNHMLLGNVGNLRKHFIEGTDMVMYEYYSEFSSTWDMLQSWFPTILLESLELYPVRDLNGKLLAID